MIRSIRLLTLGLAAAAALTTTPVFAQKTGGPTPVTEVDKAARSAVHITYDCNEVQAYRTDYQLPPERFWWPSNEQTKPAGAATGYHSSTHATGLRLVRGRGLPVLRRKSRRQSPLGPHCQGSSPSRRR